MSDMSVFTPSPLTYAFLLPGETHLYSVVLEKAVGRRLFIFAGQKLYGGEPGAVCYWAHLTDQRFLLEVYPYSKTERAIMGVAIFLMGALFDNPQAKAQLAAQNIMIKVNEAREGDPNAQYLAIPYDRLKVTCFKNTFTNFLKLEITGINDEVVFKPLLRVSGNFIEDVKKGIELAPRVAELCQHLIDAHQRAKQSK